MTISTRKVASENKAKWPKYPNLTNRKSKSEAFFKKTSMNSKNNITINELKKLEEQKRIFNNKIIQYETAEKKEKL